MPVILLQVGIIDLKVIVNKKNISIQFIISNYIYKYYLAISCYLAMALTLLR